MSDSRERHGPEWQPFTPHGVARAALAPRWQLWVVLGLTALLSAGVLTGFVQRCWKPVVDSALTALPTGARIDGAIFHPGSATSTQTLAANPWLAVGIQWNTTVGPDETSDIWIQLGIDEIRACSLLGCVALPYTDTGGRPLTRADMVARWRAWSPTLTGGLILGHIFQLVLSWWVLTLIYSAVIRFLAFYFDRQVDFRGSCRIAQASLVMPALALISAAFAYQQRWIGLAGLLIVFVLHVPLACLLWLLSVRHLPKLKRTPKGNPFHGTPGQPPSPRKTNPFSSRT